MSGASQIYHYDRTQRGFHWLMAALILVALGIGIYAAWQAPGTSPRRELLDIHKSVGLTVLLLLPLRLVYRLIAGEPAYRAPPSRSAHLAAKVAHWSLYVLMLLLPVSGYVYSAAGGYGLPLFGLFSFPRLVPVDKALSQAGYGAHYWIAWAVGIVLALHVLAVAWHAWIRRDEVMGRMWPRRVAGG
ncbi:cytochrome b [Methylobacterium nonmethylotrophicum]|uniref:Cytochrome b n=1 Tax=Methylobacterium nonmethylotrophicum TaxID=1141884 RepID=A0A4Z0NFI3_9HYPH|nr:cytochrome b [Methylobacterium nonmethylotrophicum]TGD95066.1 cytochrome b [Methylobacterium nonmethylotrophicum]